MRVAFKEWAIVVDALGCGEQIIILRKGGISEEGGAFRPEYARFLLFPTLFHQQRESVIGTAQKRFDEIAASFPPAHELRIGYYAEVIDSRQLLTLEAAQALRGQHIWRDEVVADRFDWGRAKNIYAMAVRVFRLPEERVLPMAASYAGCRSWVELEEEIDRAKSEPALSEDAFRLKLSEFQSVLV
jgi:hypothetical protein